MWEYLHILFDVLHLILALGFLVAAFRNINKNTAMAWVYCGISIGILTGL